MTEIFAPKKRGMPLYIAGKPVFRITDYNKNTRIYFYVESLIFTNIKRGDRIRILKTNGTFYLHIKKENENIPIRTEFYKIGGRKEKPTLEAQFSCKAGKIPEGVWIIQNLVKHPEYNIMVFPLKFDHR